MKRLLIIDGHNLLFQMFYGMPSRIINARGEAIHGVLGFVGAVFKIIKMVSPSDIVVLFDGEHENSRSQINSEYKKNRIDYTDIPEADNPFSQLKYISEALNYMGIKCYEEDVYEVDDVIASYVYKYKNETNIIISSFDSDYFQLIDENVSVLRYRGKNTKIYDKISISEKLGVLPEFYADFKSLTGDHADNIKGVEKIGIKTAAELIRRFGNIENIIANSNKIEKERIRNSIKSNVQSLRNNYKLIKLTDVNKIPFALDELDYSDKGLTTNAVLKGIGLLY